MLVFPFIEAQDGAVAQQSAVSGILAQVHVGYAVSVQQLFGTTQGRAQCCLCFSLSVCFSSAVVFSQFSASLPPPPLFFLLFFFSFHCYHSVTPVPGCPCGWGLMAGLQGLLAIGVFYCLGAGWSQLRPFDILGSHLPLSLMHLLTKMTLHFCYTHTLFFHSRLFRVWSLQGTCTNL